MRRLLSLLLLSAVPTALAVCGDGLVGAKEVCDGLNLNGHTCYTHGFPAGPNNGLKCGADCNSWDESGCHQAGAGTKVFYQTLSTGLIRRATIKPDSTLTDAVELSHLPGNVVGWGSEVDMVQRKVYFMYSNRPAGGADNYISRMNFDGSGFEIVYKNKFLEAAEGSTVAFDCGRGRLFTASYFPRKLVMVDLLTPGFPATELENLPFGTGVQSLEYNAVSDTLYFGSGTNIYKKYIPADENLSTPAVLVWSGMVPQALEANWDSGEMYILTGSNKAMKVDLKNEADPPVEITTFPNTATQMEMDTRCKACQVKAAHVTELSNGNTKTTHYLVDLASGAKTVLQNYDEGINGMSIAWEGCRNFQKEKDEQCDWGEFGGETCESLHFDKGTLKCDPCCCKFDTSECQKCGDGKVSGDEECEPGLPVPQGMRCTKKCKLVPICTLYLSDLYKQMQVDGTIEPWWMSVITTKGDIGSQSIPYASDFEGAAAACGNSFFQHFSLNDKANFMAGETSLYTEGDIQFLSGNVNNGGAEAGGDATFSYGKIAGSVHSQMDINLQNYQVGKHARAGADVNADVGSVVLGNTEANVNWNADPRPPSAFRCKAAKIYFTRLSKFILNRPDSPGLAAVLKYGRLTISNVKPGLNYLTVDAATWNAASSYAVLGQPGATLFINIAGQALTLNSIQLVTKADSMGPASVIGTENILVNLHEAETLTLDGSLDHSLLAPKAATQFRNGQVQGTVVVKSLHGRYESKTPHGQQVNEPPFQGELPDFCLFKGPGGEADED